MYQARYQRIVDHILVHLFFGFVRLHLPDQPIYILTIHLSDDLAPLLFGLSVLLDRTVSRGLEEVNLYLFALTPGIRASPRRALAMIVEEYATIDRNRKIEPGRIWKRASCD
jgi:hypothetical protein